jgi:hypothetical protein
MFDEFANLHQLRATHLGVCRLGSVASASAFRSSQLRSARCVVMQIQDLGTRRPGPVAASRASPFRNQLAQRPGRRTDVQYAPHPSSPHSVCIPIIIIISSSSNPRYHTVYTIDDASTTEVDDGISVEWQTGGSTGPNNW